MSYLPRCGLVGIISTWNWAYHRRLDPAGRTHHVSFAILAALAIRNERLQAKIKHSEVLDRVLFGIQPADDPKAFPLVDLLANPVELSAQVGKREVVSGDTVTIKTHICFIQ